MKKLLAVLLMVFGCSDVADPTGGGFLSPQPLPDPKTIDVHVDSVWIQDAAVWVALDRGRGVEEGNLRAVRLLDHENNGELGLLPFGGNPDVSIWFQFLGGILLDSVTVQYETPNTTLTCCGTRLQGP